MMKDKDSGRQWGIKQRRSRPWRWLGGTLVLGMLLAGCGPNLQAQCTEVISKIQAAEGQRPVGDVTPAVALEMVQSYETLAADLTALDLPNDTLSDYRDQLVAGYQSVAAVTQQRAEMMDESGSISYRPGTEAEQAVNALRAEEMRAHNTVMTAGQQIANHCR